MRLDRSEDVAAPVQVEDDARRVGALRDEPLGRHAAGIDLLVSDAGPLAWGERAAHEAALLGERQARRELAVEPEHRRPRFEPLVPGRAQGPLDGAADADPGKHGAGHGGKEIELHGATSMGRAGSSSTPFGGLFVESPWLARPQARAMVARMVASRWNPDRYEARASFVTRLGADLLDLLAAKAGERVLDLGCG